MTNLSVVSVFDYVDVAFLDVFLLVLVVSPLVERLPKHQDQQWKGIHQAEHEAVPTNHC